jgi:hypothetical protein
LVPLYGGTTFFVFITNISAVIILVKKNEKIDSFAKIFNKFVCSRSINGHIFCAFQLCWCDVWLLEISSIHVSVFTIYDYSHGLCLNIHFNSYWYWKVLKIYSSFRLI